MPMVTCPLHCPECNRIILDSTEDGGFKLRTRLVLLDEEESHALCPACKSKVTVPITIGSNIHIKPKGKHYIND